MKIIRISNREARFLMGAMESVETNDEDIQQFVQSIRRKILEQYPEILQKDVRGTVERLLDKKI